MKPIDVAYIVAMFGLAAYIFWSTLTDFSLGQWLTACL